MHQSLNQEKQIHHNKQLTLAEYNNQDHELVQQQEKKIVREEEVHNHPNLQSRFPFRSSINIVLIIFITIQVLAVISSRIYLRGDLIRSFLQVYFNQDQYPQLFSGQAYYLKILNITQLSSQLTYSFESMEIIDDDSFLQINYKDSMVTLTIQYCNDAQFYRQTQFIIDPLAGIVVPFDMTNITTMQKFFTQINWFKIKIDNLTVAKEGFQQKYVHQILYKFQESLEINIQFNFRIDDAMLNSIDVEKPQANYIFALRAFYFIIMMISFYSLFLNYRYIRRTVRILFEKLSQYHATNQQLWSSMVPPEEIIEIQENVQALIKAYKLKTSNLRFQHYFYAIEFDIIFSVISNVFTTIGSFYLFIGMEKEILIGLSCISSWMTIFKFLKAKKRLVLMYQLIKLSIVKVTFFFIQFFPVFLSYAFLGICLFPKVLYFSSMSYSVTTLVSLMMGDSIDQITTAMQQKNSTALSGIYIFTFVLLFMHAIHNTLTALIKEAFILKKIQLIRYEKKMKKQNEFIYLSEVKCSVEEQKQKLPVKLTQSMYKSLLKINYLKKGKQFRAKLKQISQLLQQIFYQQKWDVEDFALSPKVFRQYLKEIQRRRTKIKTILVRLQQQIQINDKKQNSMGKSSLFTQGQRPIFLNFEQQK